MAAVYCQSIDAARAKSTKYPNPAYYIAHAVRRQVASSALFIGTAHDTQLLRLVSRDSTTLTQASAVAHEVLSRLTRPPPPSTKRVRLALTDVGLLDRATLLDILAKLGTVVHLAMHGPKSLPEYGNRVTATLKVPIATAIPDRMGYSYAGAKLHFLCKLHEDQHGPAHKSSAPDEDSASGSVTGQAAPVLSSSEEAKADSALAGVSTAAARSQPDASQRGSADAAPAAAPAVVATAASPNFTSGDHGSTTPSNVTPSVVGTAVAHSDPRCPSSPVWPRLQTPCTPSAQLLTLRGLLTHFK
jgi:hypothetical protein